MSAGPDSLPPDVEERFLDVVELDPDARASEIEGLCRDFPDHAERIRDRAARAAEIEAELERDLPLCPADERVPLPARIGPYRPFEQLGEGGMGSVYLAEQLEPIRRQVALKIIKPGMDSRRVLRRFEFERQVLGRLSHPCIARVFDAGLTDDGRSYFVMEYITGSPITDWCVRKALSLHERLELFCRVCDAVQYAHLKGVIHRDLKPSNILVDGESGQATPKIIDFGLARATGSDPDEHDEASMLTLQGAVVGTPEYMSPEQATGAGADLDTRTDVYALGVVLYELLTGDLPLAGEHLRKLDLVEMQRRIREQEPPTPSSRVGSRESGSRGRASGAAIGAEVVAARALRGELDWITMKALAKERERRYQSAAALLDDVRRFLRREPVAAGPPTLSYRVGKFLRRHRFQVTAAAAVALAIAVGLVSSVWLWLDARAARVVAEERADEAESVADFLVGIFESAHFSNSFGADIPVRLVLERGERELESRLEQQPAVRARLLLTLGRVHASLGSFDTAREAIERAIAIQSTIPAHDPVELEQYRALLTEVLAMNGEPTRAIELARDVVVRAEERGDAALLATGMEAYAIALNQSAADPAEPVAVARRLVELRDATPEVLRERASARSILGSALHNAKEFAEAQSVFEAAFALLLEEFPGGHPEVVALRVNMTRTAIRLGDRVTAARHADAMIAEAERLCPDDHPLLGVVVQTYATFLGDLGRPEEAEQQFLRSLTIFEQSLPPRHPLLAWSLTDLGALLLRRDRVKEARAHLERAAAIYAARFPDGHRHRAIAQQRLTEALARDGGLERALEVATESLAMVLDLELGAELEGDAHQVIAFVQNVRGDGATAASEARLALGAYEAAGVEDDSDVALTCNYLGWALMQTTVDDIEAVLAPLRRSVAIYDRISPSGDVMAAFPLTLIALAQQNATDEALHSVERAVELRTRFLPFGDGWRTASVRQLGEMYLARNRYAESEPLLREVLEVCVENGNAAATEAARELLASLYESWGKRDAAARVRDGR